VGGQGRPRSLPSPWFRLAPDGRVGTRGSDQTADEIGGCSAARRGGVSWGAGRPIGPGGESGFERGDQDGQVVACGLDEHDQVEPQ
jgi:hypothetical protein